MRLGIAAALPHETAGEMGKKAQRHGTWPCADKIVI